MTITRQPSPACQLPDIDDAWALYASVFAEINELAAERHLMTRKEFNEIFDDPRVLKFYARDENNQLIGMSVLTQQLDAWPLISPPYFARRWPNHYDRKAIWYVGFVGVVPNHTHAFRRLVTSMYPHVIGNRGFAVMDFCTHNVTSRRLPEITLKLLGRLNASAGMYTADAQSFVVYHFDQRGDT